QANAQQATAAKDEEQKARKRAEATGDFVVKALNTSDPNNAGGRQDMTVLEAMDNATLDIDSGRFANDPETEGGLRHSIGQIVANHGRLQQAEQLQAGALELMQKVHQGDHEDVANVLDSLARVRGALGRAEAEPLFVQALEMARRLHPGDHPMVV